MLKTHFHVNYSRLFWTPGIRSWRQPVSSVCLWRSWDCVFGGLPYPRHHRSGQTVAEGVARTSHDLHALQRLPPGHRSVSTALFLLVRNDLGDSNACCFSRRTARETRAVARHLQSPGAASHSQLQHLGETYFPSCQVQMSWEKRTLNGTKIRC